MDPHRDDGADLERLVREARAGDAAALEQLVEACLPHLRAAVRLRMGPALRARESASDVVQSICREVLSNLDRYEPRDGAGFRRWLHRLALNKIVDKQRYWRADRRDPGKEVPLDGVRSRALLEAYAAAATPSRAAVELEDLRHIEEAFDRLPERQRDVILLTRVVGLSHREVADELGVTEEASRALLRRALVRLAGLLDHQG